MEGRITVCFLLSGRLCFPIGGHKIVYQYSNYLADSGMDVLIVNSVFRPSSLPRVVEMLRKVYSWGRNCLRSLLHKNTCADWFSLHEGVREVQVWTYEKKFMPAADYYIATDALTSPFLLEYSVPDDHKLYFIQGYENWLVGDDALIRSFHYPFTKLVIADWLRRKLNSFGEDAILIPIGYDQDRFSLVRPVEKRNKTTLSILYHEMPEKNFEMGLTAASFVREKYPELRLLVFGIYKRPSSLPEWCEYFQSPSKNEHNRINNDAAIYLGTSSTEGLGLTVLEAMACGQAVVCTDIDGYKEVAVDGETALLSPANDPRAMADNIVHLIEDDDLRIRIAWNGNKKMQEYSSESSCKKFRALFN